MRKVISCSKISLFSAFAFLIAGCFLILISNAHADSPWLELSQTDVMVNRGGGVKLTATVQGYTGKSKLTWSSENKKIATVNAGTIRGVSPGETTITCTAELASGEKLTSSCHVTCNVQITTLGIKSRRITMGMHSVQSTGITYKPSDATNTLFNYQLSAEDVIQISADGMITAIHPGTVTVVATTTDGSEKKVTFEVVVPALSTEESVIRISDKHPSPIIVYYYGDRFERDVTIACSGIGAVSTATFDPEQHAIIIHLIPMTAADYDITVKDAGSQSSVSVKCKVEHSAVYDNSSYPYVNYEGIVKTGGTKGKASSLRGRVLDMAYTDEGWLFRVGVGGQPTRVMCVIINDHSDVPRYIDGDMITAYGHLGGFYPGTKIPSLYAEMIEGDLGYLYAEEAQN